MSLVKINFFGDLNLGYHKVNDPFANIKKDLLDADLNVCNLEGPLIKNHMKGYIKKTAPICTLADNIEYFSNNNINCFCLANNHVFDYRYEGVKETINNLDLNKIKYFGFGENIEKSKKPFIYKKDNISIGFWGFAWNITGAIYAKKNKPGVTPIKRKIIFETIKSYKDKLDFLVVELHFGYEFENIPLPSHRKLCQDLIDLGVNIVVCHHPHIPQGFEKYKTGFIAYSLGNFIFANIYHPNGKLLRKWPEESNQSFFLKIRVLENKKFDYKIVPIKVANKKIFYLNGQSVNLFEKKINELSYSFNLNFKEYFSYWSKKRIRKLPDAIFENHFIMLTYIYLHKIYEKYFYKDYIQKKINNQIK